MMVMSVKLPRWLFSFIGKLTFIIPKRFELYFGQANSVTTEELFENYSSMENDRLELLTYMKAKGIDL